MNELARLRRKIVNRDAVPLVNTMVSIREEGGPPVRLYARPDSVTPMNVHGTTFTDENGMIDLYVKGGLRLKIIAYSSNRNELYRESIGGAYGLHSDQAEDDTTLNVPFQTSSPGTGEGSGSGGNVYRTITNNGSFVIQPGAPVTPSRGAIGNFSGKNVIGLYSDTVNLAQGSIGNVMVEGIHSMAAVTWQAITGMVGGLVPGSRYFLDFETEGRLILSAAPPDGVAGLYVIGMGYALSSTDFKLEIQPAVRVS